MAVHHVDLPEQVVSPGEELWVKIIDIDLQRRRISLSIKQAAEGGEVAAEYREAFGEHAYDEQGNYIGAGYTAFEPESEAQAAWADYLEEQAQHQEPGSTPEGDSDGTATEASLENAGLENASLENASLESASLENASLENGGFAGTEADAGAEHAGAASGETGTATAGEPGGQEQPEAAPAN